MSDESEDKGKDFARQHFSDEELEAAVAGFEKEFAGESGETSGSVTDAPDALGAPDMENVEIPDDASEIDPSVGFDEALAGLLGDKAKMAALVTRVASAELLAAFCQLADISADCVGSNQGAIAVLRNLDGDSPEAAAKDITTVVSGMSVILGVNRADKLQIMLYAGGKAGSELAPPVLFNSTPRFVEDLMLGITTVAQLKTRGFEVIDSGRYDRASAMRVISKHTRFGKGGSTRGSSIK
ncbi:hypothetical protein [Bifidobacterium panos]|uniref:Uncharacterized protein n=1 Tax=Bifidobacterium panos TaxID=2675321 RepID=A0ABX1SYL0_9BIFI|nr:hypothetical protein [Bifidobacterium sp. DSM 109963]NMN01694.1 hypothetical protein [Bifidobacterium sp. DSM 109963]